MKENAIKPAQLQQLLRIGKEILAELDIDLVLTAAMDHLIEISNAERGIIVLFDQGGENQFQTARNLQREDIERPEFEISRTIIDRVKSDSKPIYLLNAMEEPSLQKSKSVEELKILSIICLPLNHQGKLFGVIYLDNRTVKGAFKSETFALVTSFAEFISLAARHALERKHLQNRQRSLEDALRSRYDFDAIIGHAPKMMQVLELISQVADTDAPVLIEGESGTGKELVAQAIHFNSRRRDKPFIRINCAAFPENLLESEFFGYEKGAFTGAYKDHRGKFEQADCGSIFLDEIDEMSPALQAKLLRVLQNGEFSVLGSEETKQCDVRIVAASKQSLANLVNTSGFREDLYYRLNVIRIEMPSLKERQEDILLLAEHFLKKACKKIRKRVPPLSLAARQAMQRYAFPGNVRELENIIQRAAILCRGLTIDLEHLPEELRTVQFGTRSNDETYFPTFKEAKDKVVANFERRYLQQILDECDGVIKLAAQRAGMHTKNLHQKLAKYSLHAKSSKPH